jgi:hypothetical protein
MKHQTEGPSDPERKGMAQACNEVSEALIKFFKFAARATCRGIVNLLSRWT